MRSLPRFFSLMRSNAFLNIAYLSIRSFDDGTPEGRSRERYRLAAWGALANVVSSSLALVVMVITVPLTLSYLGNERFGVWMTVGSLASLLSFLDLGVGNGLISRVAKAKVEAEGAGLSSVISHGLLVLLFVGVGMGISLFFLAQYLPLDRLIKVSDPVLARETEVSIMVFCAIFAAGIPLGGVQKIFQGLQHSWLIHAAKGLGSLLSLLLVYMAAERKAGVPMLLATTYGVQTFVFAGLFFRLVSENMIRIPRFDRYNFLEESKSLLGVGGLFFVLQVGYLVGWSSDSLIISSVLGADDVASFAVVQRLFQFVFIPLSIMNAPLWGAYADASARGDLKFISSTMVSSLLRTTVFALVGCLGLVFLSPVIFRIWLPQNITVSKHLVLFYGFWIFVQSIFIPVSILLNGLSIIKAQVIIVVAFCLICLPLKFVLVQQVGVEGVIQAATIAYLFTAAVPYVFMLSRGSLRQYWGH